MAEHPLVRLAFGVEVMVLFPLAPPSQRLMDVLGVSVSVMTRAIEGGVECVIGGCDWQFIGNPGRVELEAEKHRRAEHGWVAPGRREGQAARSLARDANRDALDALDAAIPQRDVAQVDEAPLSAVDLDLETRDCAAPGCPREAAPNSSLCEQCAKNEALTPLDVLAKKRKDSLQSAAPATAKTVEVTLQPAEKRRGGMGRKPQYTRESVIELVQAHVKANGGRVPTFTEFFKAKELPSEPVLKRLGWTFGDAVEAAGFDRPAKHVNRTKTRDPEFPKPKILQLLREDALARGRPPTSAEWRVGAEGRPTEGYVRKVFGSWNAALEEAGLETLPTGKTLSTRQTPPVVWTIKVPGTGLKYRTVEEAVEAADRIEEDGVRVASSAREDGNDARAEEAHDQSWALANKIRVAAGVDVVEVAASEREDESAERSGPQMPVATGAGEPLEHEVEVERETADTKLVRSMVSAIDTFSRDLALLEDDADGWVERLQAERDRLLGEAERMTRRAGGFQTIVDGLEVLRETAA